MIDIAIFLGLLSPFLFIYLLCRFDEYLDDCKTRRRYNHFENIYFDYHHKIWVNKYVPETIPAIDITEVAV